MTVTFITTKPPSRNSGAEVRNFYLLKALENSDFVDQIRIIFLPIDSGTKVSPEILRCSKVKILTIPYGKRNIVTTLKSFLFRRIPYIDHLKSVQKLSQAQTYIQESDIIFLSELDSFFATEDILPFSSKSHKIILDCHNIDYLRFKSEIESGTMIKKVAGWSLVSKLKKMEQRAIQLCDTVLCCSESDSEYFRKIKKSGQVLLVPNGVTNKLIMNKRSSDTLNVVFMGLLSYMPNDDALRYYLDLIHPHILRFHNNLKLRVIGKNPPNWLIKRAENDSSIVIEGFVQDIRPLLGSATFCICPLRYGAGTRLKILEYMATSNAVVSTTIGAEGIQYTNGKNILIADSPQDFILGMNLLIEDKKLTRNIGIEARSLILKHYVWEDITSELLKTII